MSDRPTPFGLAFGPLAGERFPEIAAALAHGATSSADRDAFVLRDALPAIQREFSGVRMRPRTIGFQVGYAF